MTDDNQDILTAEDRELFLDIAKELRKNPTKYREAGNWLDEYCSEDAYWQHQQTKLEELQRKKNEFPVLTNIRSVEQLERKIKERQSPALYIRFKEAQNYLLKKYKNEHFIHEDDAKQIILITWILTDPNAEKADIGITEFEKWLWEPINDLTNVSRGTAQSLWVNSRDGYERWMKLVRVARSKLAERMVETGSLPTKVAKPTFARNFLRNFLRASIKHFPFGGAFLYDVIYGTLDDQASKKQMTPQPEAPQAGVTFQKDQEGSFVKGDVEKWYKTNTFKYVIVPLAAALIVAIPAWIALFHGDSAESGDGGAISTQSKLPLSLKEIRQDIDSRPLLQRDVTAKQYIGIKVENERLILVYAQESSIEETISLMMIRPEQLHDGYVTGRYIRFNVEKEKYPELVAAKQRTEFRISGRISNISNVLIDLSDVSLSFD